MKALVMPPYRVYRDFLDFDTQRALFAWAIENEAKFESTTIGSGTRDSSARVSVAVRDFGPMKEVFRQRVLAFVPTLIGDLHITPFEPSKVALELAAHNDGAFYKRHLDTYVGEERRTSDRLLSAVYYFYGEPKGFSGGALRLYSFGANGDEHSFSDVQPENNTLLVFPSWAEHEVLPVTCPSKRFSDSRFAVNCWVHRQLAKARLPPNSCPIE